MSSTTQAIPTIGGIAAAVPSGQPQLRANTLSLTECLGQSIANIAPTLTPALNISVVVGMAGIGSWVAYLVATVGMLFVSANISSLAKRHPVSGSYFVYIGRTFGPFAGLIAGWSMIAAYLLTAVAVVVSVTLFLANVFTAFGLKGLIPPDWIVACVFTAGVFYAAYRDIRMSSRVALVLEAISVGIIVVVTAIVVAKHGTVVDPKQLDLGHLGMKGVMSSLAFAVFSFVGFESAATLAKETRNPEKTIPLAVTVSCVVVGLFFVVMCYLMVLGTDDNVKAIGDSTSPFAEMTTRAGFASLAGIVYFAALISAFACALASVNAASRLIFSMGRYKFFSHHMGRVHATHQTPHLAVGISSVFTVVVSLLVLPLGALNAFGYTGTFATFGFLVVYLLICVVSPMDRYKAGTMKPQHVAIGVIGAALLAFVIFGSLYPVPDYPYNLLPYLFAAYLALGAAWFGYLKLRAPAVLATMEHDMEL